MTFRAFFGALTASLVVAATTWGADWITAPSYYTHDPATGERVDQYTPIGPFYTFARTDFLRSGYRHTRSSIQAGQSADHMHIVEEWGREVRPYGEWRFPYRPYSVPYSLWGAPFAGMGYPGYYAPYAAPYDVPQTPGYDGPYDRQQPPPYYDGNYPAYRPRPRGDAFPQPGQPSFRAQPRTQRRSPPPDPDVETPPRSGGGSA